MDLLIVTVISLDLFFVCISYGIRSIKIPISSMLTMSAISMGYLMASILVGKLIICLIPNIEFKYLSFTVLFSMSLINLFDEQIKWIIEKIMVHKIKFKLSKFVFVLEICVDKTKVDKDHSNTITPTEAAFLALPLSIDCFITGLGISFTLTKTLLFLPYLFLISLVLSFLGTKIGEKISDFNFMNTSYISGIFLLIIAISKLC